MKKRVAVLFGGKAPEHEVSIITGIQILHGLRGAGHEALAVYVSKEGKWVLGDESFWDPKNYSDLGELVKKARRGYLGLVPGGSGLVVEGRSVLFKREEGIGVDVFFPAFHGRYGEDGSIQGLFELANVAYVGCNVQASAVGMDKQLSKRVAESIGVPVLKSNWIGKEDSGDVRKLADRAMEGLKYPVYVKPARLGSSIGITRAENEKELSEAIEVAFCYDTKAMVEQGLDDAVEVNISLLGNNPYEVSATETPVASGRTLSFEDKYISKEGGASKGMATARRIVPAKIKEGIRRKVEGYGRKFFAEIDGCGICRIDFLVSKDEGRVYFNEINTLPGSIAFYLWKEKGIAMSALTDRLVELAIERKKQKEGLIASFESNILEGYGSGGAKLKLGGQ
jgi:D-alanine-D-alanine ligase